MNEAVVVERELRASSGSNRCSFYPLDQKPGTYLLYNLETKRLTTSRNVYLNEEFRFVERTTGVDGAPAWLLKLDADTTAVESQLSHADGDAITHAATLDGDFLESVGVPTVGETVGVGGSVGEKNNGSTRYVTKSVCLWHAVTWQ